MTNEEDKAVFEKDQKLAKAPSNKRSSKLSLKGPQESGQPGADPGAYSAPLVIHPAVIEQADENSMWCQHEKSIEGEVSIKSSQRGKDATTITLGKARSIASDKAKNKITEEVILKGKKLTLQVWIYMSIDHE